MRQPSNPHWPCDDDDDDDNDNDEDDNNDDNNDGNNDDDHLRALLFSLPESSALLSLSSTSLNLFTAPAMQGDICDDSW